MEDRERIEEHGRQFVTLEEAGQLLGLDPRTIKRRVEEGRLVGFRVGRRYRIRRVDLWRFLDASRIEAEVAPR